MHRSARAQVFTILPFTVSQYTVSASQLERAKYVPTKCYTVMASRADAVFERMVLQLLFTKKGLGSPTPEHVCAALEFIE